MPHLFPRRRPPALIRQPEVRMSPMPCCLGDDFACAENKLTGTCFLLDLAQARRSNLSVQENTRTKALLAWASRASTIGGAAQNDDRRSDFDQSACRR